MSMLNTARASLYGGGRTSKFNIIFVAAVAVLIVILAFETFFNLNYRSIYVQGESMSPTLTGAPSNVSHAVRGGDYVFVDVHARPGYRDIVVMRAGTGKSNMHNIIKRAVAFGGDTVKIEGGVLYLKKVGQNEFVAQDEDYVSPLNASADYNYGEHTVAENCIFVLGDNRDNSTDSRGQYGDFSYDALVGVVPWWSLKFKGAITSIYTFFDFDLGLNRLKTI